MRSGQVVAASVKGYGSSGASAATNRTRGRRAPGQDVWWNYTILSDGQVYSVESRENPTRTGLTTNSHFQFYEAKNWIYIPKAKGKPATLKILNKSWKK
jgi:hypothetical protein